MVSGTVTLQNGQSALDFLERTSMDAQVSSDKIRAITSKTPMRNNYPNNGLAKNLQLVSRLIAGGLPSLIFYVSQGGYDTHTGQRNAQDNRLRELADSVKAFTDDLAAMGLKPELIETPRDVDAVCAQLQDEFEVAPEVCRAEVESFLNELVMHGAIALDPPPAA